MQTLRTKLAEYNGIFWRLGPVMAAIGFFAVSLLFAITNWITTGPDLLAQNGMPLGADFISFWSAAWLTVTGNAAGVYDDKVILAAHGVAVAANSTLTPYHYPPTFTLLLWPLGKMPYLAAYLLFVLSTAALYLFAGWKLRPHWTTPVFLLGFPAFWLNLIDGQNAFLTASLMGLALLGLQRHPYWAGVALGLLTFKPQLGLAMPVALLAAGKWKTILAALVTAVAFAAASYAMLGGEAWLAFIRNLSDPIRILEENRLPIDRMTSAFSMVMMLQDNVEAAYLAQLLSAAIGMVAVFCSWRSDASVNLKGAILVIASLMCTPHVFHYDQPILGVALLLWLKEAENSGWRFGERLLMLLAWLGTFVLLPASHDGQINLYPLMLVMLQIFLLHRLNSDSTAA